MNPGFDTIGRVFKLCFSFALSSFECKSEDILDFGAKFHDFTNFEVRANMSS